MDNCWSVFDCLDSKIVFAFEYAGGSKPSADEEILKTFFLPCFSLASLTLIFNILTDAFLTLICIM
jgi:hypothetical protein